MSEKIIEALMVTAELTGASFSKPALKAICFDLAGYDENDVLKALSWLRRNLKGPLRVGHITERLDSIAGFLSSEEAWSIAFKSFDEQQTVVMTAQIAEARNVALDCMPDKVAARMAFKATYERLCEDAKEQGIKPEWFPSLGFDKQEREPELRKAAQAGRLPMAHVEKLLLGVADRGDQLLIETNATHEPKDCRDLIANLRKQLGAKK